MKVLCIIAEFLKVAFSGFANSIFRRKRKQEILIAKNEDTEISDNESNECSIAITKNKKSKVRGNKWK